MAKKTTKRVIRSGEASKRTREDRGMVQRLKDQLKVQSKVAEIHLNKRMLKEMAFYPAHDKRTETPQYKAIHKKLTVELDLPCLICGVKHSTLQDKEKNRYGAKAMETHHYVIEWSLANAIDPQRFNEILLPHLKRRHAGKPEYEKSAFTEADIAAWVDHSEDNLWVLCDVHHRAQYFGIHEITYPIWGPMDLLRQDFSDYVKEQIAKEKPETKKRKKTR